MDRLILKNKINWILVVTIFALFSHCLLASTPLFSYPGWNIFDNGGAYNYRYGPSIIINTNGSIDMWTAAPGSGGQWDCIRHKNSTNGGVSWGSETVVLTGTSGKADGKSVCDPGVFKYGSYYYIGYTGIAGDEASNNNHVFVARSTSPTGSYQKWNGSGWGGDPQPFITYTGSLSHWGAGEPSFVVKDGTLYIYYTWSLAAGAVWETRVATASISNANWPGSLTYRGTAISRGNGEASTDIKYIDGMGKFIGVAERNRLQASSYIVFYESANGLNFTLSNTLTDYIMPYSHNSGISGRCDGHLKLEDKNFIAYAYGSTWGRWSTFLNPIHFNELVAVKKYNTGSGKTEAHIMSGLDDFSSFTLQVGTTMGTTSSDWQFIVSDWNDDTKADLFGVKRTGSSGKTEIYIMDRSTSYQSYLASIATTLGATNSNWSFDLADRNGDGVLDLFCINRVGGSNKTDVHILNGANGFQSFLANIATVLGATDSTWDFEVSDYNDDGIVDIFCIDRIGGSGKTDVHVLNGANGFQSYLANIATVLGATNSDWTFEVTDWNNDSYADVIAIKKAGSSKVEVNILDGSAGFQSYLSQNATILDPVGSNFELLISSFEE